MSKLHPDKQFPVSKEMLAPVLSKYGISDFTFESLHQGIANTSVRIESAGKRYVLRLYRQDRKTDVEIEFELSFQDYLRANGIPIPTVYKNQDGRELSTVEAGGNRFQAILM